MEISKSIIAVAISSAFLFGCDFDVGPESANNAGDDTSIPGDGGGLPPVEGAENFVQIQDSAVDTTGILRVKTSESKSDTAVDNIPVGFLTVDLTYQDNAAINGENAAANAYIQLHTTAGSSNAHLRGEIALGEGVVKYRDTTGSLVTTDGTYTPDEELQLTVVWTESEFSFSIGDDDFGPYPATNTNPVELISLKVGDSKTKADLELIADNLKIYSGTEAENELIFEDDFDGYGVGDDLTNSRYNRAIDLMVVGTGGTEPGDGGTEPGDGGTEPGDFPAPVNEYAFTADNLLTDSATTGNTIKVSGDGTFDSVAGAKGEVGNAADLNQDGLDGVTVGKDYSYLYYQGDESSTTGVQQITGSFAIEAVLKPESRLDMSYYGDDVSILEFYNKDSGNDNFETGFKLYIEGDSGTHNAIKLKVYGGATNSELNSGDENLITPEGWNHIMAVYDADTGEFGQLQIYLDGSLVQTKDLTFAPIPNENLTDKMTMLGGANSSDKNFNGQVDNIALWAQSLTAEQIAERAENFGLLVP
ncbi:LamG-like jellyroll fold domain-containing protein [Vibrio breoganii]|uniref:LamG-like jellyroll fold domain-containing protein n=1 Tax=Vibrio breoganii TaxID=553239 RepID=UPI000C81B162|nr:LamG-like jellyroll fold domain-containing protein [Vibrio breoganii]PMM82049.1 hypothetical protein BCT44_12520 [Vibrio breoganii]